ncbi:MAG TPA: NAD-glutamate dehydrogenase [Steroidobacteraceae bacterium]|nr:NAD-glutamate dehydrogenase [Steroidobacteraceae bacterium]
MHGKIPAARLELIERIAARARKQRTAINAKQFIHAYYYGVSEEDLAERRPEDLAGAALAHLTLGKTRRPGKPLVRVFNPDLKNDGFTTSHTLIALVTDDMPFLVDSLGIIFNQSSLAIHFIAHPVLNVRRDGSGHLKELLEEPPAENGHLSESWQLFEVDRVPDAKGLEALRERILTTLDDVRSATGDWLEMRHRARTIATEIESRTPALPSTEVIESKELLEWMEDNHFTFLGYREYRLRRGRSSDQLEPDAASGLGLLRPGREHGRKPRVVELTGEIRDNARDKTLLIITKANTVSTVHRATYLDYVGIKTFDAAGEVNGEQRFIGLWTSSAYSKSPREIPVLRHKVQRVIAHFGVSPTSHDGKAVMHVLETYPRDELFQASVPDVVRIVRGIVNLYERHQVRLFVRRDAFRRFYSCLVYVPRDRYNTQVRQRIEAITREEFHGGAIESQVQLSDSVLARLHLLVRTDPNDVHRADTTKIEQRIAAAVRTWLDGLKDALLARHDEAKALKLFERYMSRFPPAYQDDTPPALAVRDIDALEAITSGASTLQMSLHRAPDQSQSQLHFRLFRPTNPMPISDVLPMMENLGLKVISEHPYDVEWPTGGMVWIQDFELQHRAGLALELPHIDRNFQDTFASVLRGEASNDGFNRLVLAAGLTWRQTALLRAYCRYLLQTGLPFSQAYMERVLSANAGISTLLVSLFHALFDPASKAPRRQRESARIKDELTNALEEVKSLDEDRILRAFTAVICATLRTNYFQTVGDGQPKPYFSFKLDPQQVPDLPLPKPMFEIFVYNPRVEGVHLRMGKVARGGIRWSDRREDYRTEVLGLMKAQNVKNTVIVPVGAKGGFVPKKLPSGGAREEIQREVVACYQNFIRGLLDLTDNIVGERVVPPAQTVRRDDDDTYLVVAADKGTATFSDIANELAAEYDFWLGDAFASGGSAGYDHKKIAITSRGAWECVKRHFREMGIDIQRQDFTAVGIGDMSGDVFGNGMLLSPHLRLLAAFNHQHIFIDPDPDAAAALRERQRLFNLPRSTWEDYNRKLISKGGGVFSRAAKSVPLSSQALAVLGLKVASATPLEVIRAILKAPVDLLWNGGIGTYVKSSRESHADVGDRANDGVRVNGNELRVKVVGEGGNLGLSQRGRIEYALNGGRLNTDFIDNSGGVNCSDLEVNIKILLNPLMQAGKLKRGDRDRLLASMTDEVAELVLRNNYLQSQALSTLETHAAERFSEHTHVIRVLQQSGELDPALEFLPDDEETQERRKRVKGLTRPELAIVLSYSKIWLNNKLLESDVPEDSYLSKELERYFPSAIRKRYARVLGRHRLRREIIATATTNSMVNRMGPVFASRVQEDTGAETGKIARAYTIAREVFEMRDLWRDIEGLDNRVAAESQYAMMYQTSRQLRHMTYWFLAHHPNQLDIDKSVSRLAPGVARLAGHLEQVLTGAELRRYRESVERLRDNRVPESIAVRIAGLTPMHAALDIVETAQAVDVDVLYAARTYFALGERLNLDWIREQIETLSIDGHWQAVARGALRDNLYNLQRSLASKVLARGNSKDPISAIDGWLSKRKEQLDFIRRTVTDMRTSVAADFPTLSVALQAVRRMAEH